MIKNYGIIVFTVLVGVLYSYSYFYSSPMNELDLPKVKPIHAVSKGESPCNCTLDIIDDTRGFQLPKVKIIKNESMQSQTEGALKWTESKQLAMDGVMVGDVYLANQSAGALVDLNMIRAEQNQILGLEITGGTLPDIVKVEAVNSSTAVNNTGLKIGDIQIDKKTSESTLLFNKSIEKPTLNQNSFRIQVPPQGGDAVLIVSLLYNNNESVKSVNNNVTNIPDQSNTQILTGIYEVVLSIK